VKTSRDDLDHWLKGASEVPWSKDLEARIMNQAEAMVQDSTADETMKPGRAKRRPSVRRRDLRSWLAVLGGAAAAILLAVAVWNTGARQQLVPNGPIINSTTPAAGPVHTLQSVMAPNTIGLRSAPIQVRGLGLASSVPGGPRNEVVATLVNKGTTPISKLDVFGVLSFHNSSVTTNSVLQSVDWITFVDAPNQTIMPGQSVVWTFQPTTAPTDGQGNLTDTPSLEFYWAGTASGNEVTDTWQMSPVQVAVKGVVVSSTWATGQAFAVQTAIKNTSKTPLDWNHVLAIIWFDNPSGASLSGTALTDNTPTNAPTAASTSTGSASSATGLGTSSQPATTANSVAGSIAPSPSFGFTAPGVSRYLSTISSTSGQGATLSPGASVSLTFHLVGPVDPNLTSETPHVLLIQEGTH
jgi:hypothetical protein